jgi:uncharacterized membrane protein YccC
LAASAPSTGSPRARSAISAALRQAISFDRSAVSIAGGLIAAIPLTACFGVAVAAGDPVAAATMGAGAMLVGVAWRVSGGRPPVALLSVDALLMALSTFLGSASGSRPWLHLIVLFLWSLAAGLLVAVGRRGAVVGTQAVIGIVVFGRFSEPLPGALGLAGLVFAGGLAMTLFVAIVRWPSPLALQRRTVAAAYRALAELALAPSDASTLPAAGLLDEARTALASPALFGVPAILALRGLIDEASRMRIELRAIHVLLAQGLAGDPAEQARARALLQSCAQVLRVMAAAIEGDTRAHRDLQAAIAQLPDDDRMGALDHASDAALGRRLAALGGQLRAIARYAQAAGARANVAARRPVLGSPHLLGGMRADLAQLRANATLESPAGRHALRLAVVVLTTEVIAQHIPLQRSYWMVVAAAAALRPEFAATFTRGAERIIGTCVGVALSGLIVVSLHPSLGAVVAIIGALGWLAYSVFPASFAVGFAFLTALVVFLLDAVSTDTLAIASDRLLDALIGGAIGLLAYLLWPTWSRKPARQALADVVAAQRAYAAAVLGAIVTGKRADQHQLSPLGRKARTAYTTAQETVARSLTEPSTRQIDREQSQSVIGALRRIVSVIHVLRADAQEERPRESLPALATLAGELDQALGLVEVALPSEQPVPHQPQRSPPSPDLRDGYMRLLADSEIAHSNPLLARELDELVDAVNSLGALVSGTAAQPAASGVGAPSNKPLS